jgi:hypothetical protein
MVNGKAKAILAILCIFVLVFVTNLICAGILLFGNATDNPFFIKAFQIIWCIGIVFMAITAIVLFIDYFSSNRITVYVSLPFAQLVRMDERIIAISMSRIPKGRLYGAGFLYLIWLMFFLCTFVLLFTDAKGNQQWMTTLLVIWCIFIIMIGFPLLLACCCCCCALGVDVEQQDADQSAATLLHEQTDSNLETRPLAHQTTTTSV